MLRPFNFPNPSTHLKSFKNENTNSHKSRTTQFNPVRTINIKTSTSSTQSLPTFHPSLREFSNPLHCTSSSRRRIPKHHNPDLELWSPEALETSTLAQNTDREISMLGEAIKCVGSGKRPGTRITRTRLKDAIH